MRGFADQCISLGLSIDIDEIGEPFSHGETSFYHRPGNDQQSSVASLKSNEAMKDVDKTVFILGRKSISVHDSTKKSDCISSHSKDTEAVGIDLDLVQYGRLGKNKALSSVFVLDNVLLPLLRQEIAKRQKSNQESNLRSSLHLTYAKKFASHVCRFSAQTENGLKLSLPTDIKFENRSHLDLQLLENCIKEWITSIQGVIDYELNKPHTKIMTFPLEEVEFWRRRHTVFSGILEQLKEKKVKSALDHLRTAGSHVYKKLNEKINYISKIEAEAAENMKFLATLERHFRVLKDGSLEGIHSTIPGLLDGMRMVWAISKFYCRDERMAPLLELVGKQIASKVKDRINLKQVITDDFVLSHQMLLKAKKVLEQWKTSYMDTRAKIESMGKGQRQWEFDRSSLFEKTDYMSTICSQMTKILEAMEDLHQFLKPEVNRIVGENDKSSIAFEELKRLQDLFLNFNLDPFDRNNEKEWYILRSQFNTAVGDVEEHADAFLQKAFKKLQSSESAFHLTQQFKALMSRPRIRQMISLRHQDMLQQYEEELEALEDHFMQFKDNPPISIGHQKSPGSIIWAKGLYLRAKRPILLFQKEENLLDNGLGFKIRNSYLRFARSIQSYNELIFNMWEERARITAFRCLRMPLLKVVGGDGSAVGSKVLDDPKTTDKKKVISPLFPTLQLPIVFEHNGIYRNCIDHARIQSNFSPELRILIEETKHFDAMGYIIPDEAFHLTLQEQAINRHAIDLQKLANLINETMDGMATVECALMDTHMKVLSDVLTPALETIKWSSQRISSFLSAATHAVEKFRSKLSEVRKHFFSAEVLALQIEQETLVHFDSDFDYSVSTLDQLLSSVEEVAQSKLSNLRRHYHSISQILINIEMTVCETDNGSSTTLEQCYSYWSKRIYNAITEMTLRSIFSFCSAMLSGHLSSPFCKIHINVEDKEIMSEPLLSEVKKYSTRFLRLVCNASRKFSRWISQTCLLSEENAQASSSRASTIQLEYSFYKDSSRNSIINSAILGQKVAMILLLREIDDGVQDYQVGLTAFSAKCLNWKKNLHQSIKTEVPTALIDNLARECHSNLAFPKPATKTIHFSNSSYRLISSGLESHVHETINELKLDLDDIILTLGRGNLDELITATQTYTNYLNVQPESVDELKVVINHIRNIQSSNLMIELKCKEVEEKFMLMKRQQIAVTAAEFAEATSLYSNWQNLMISARAVDFQLDAKREEFKKHVGSQILSFQSKLEQQKKRFVNGGPGCLDISLDCGYLLFQEWQTNLSHLVCINEDLNDSKEILGMNVKIYPDLNFIAESMNELSQIYEAYKVLVEGLQSQSSLAWISLDVDSIDVILRLVISKLQKIEVQHNKPTWNKVHERIKDLANTIPLLKKLHNESMKERHWEYLSKMCNMHMKSLTLCHVLEMNLHLRSNEVDKVLELAIQEEKLEKNLIKISDYWSSAQLNMKRYTGSSGQFILDSLDEIFIQLEDHQLLLRAMMGSKFSSQYLHEMKKWETSLDSITQCLSNWSYLQQKWTYLESIFSGSNDIRAQLPKGAQLFDEVSKVFQLMMKRTYEVPKVLHSCTEERSSSILRLTRKLELCQKSLSDYLRVKRSIFARFYFLSDEDMISILGNSNVALIEPHLIKMFDNIQGLEFAVGYKKVTGMKSRETETVKLIRAVDCSGRVEEWMGYLEEEMRHTVQLNVKKSIIFHATESKASWIEKSIGMCTITSCQIWWTWQVEDAFSLIKNGDRKAMQKFEMHLNSDLSDLVTMVRSDLNGKTRKKINSLVIIKVHARDIITSFVQKSVIKITGFEWESTLRFYLKSNINKVLIQQCMGSFHFGNEYLGLTKRIVMTPLTDRCYLTMTQALAFGLGGAALGPAGTGKTETIKDLAKLFGLPCFVFNCSEGLDHIAIASIFAGLLQTGAWGCFDEFNRIKVEVLSVISAQLETIRHSISKEYETVDIGIGTEIYIKQMHGYRSLGVFVTMNPSYAGRTELPDNLKSLLRPVAMVSPDCCKIVENLLYSEGFIYSRSLAKKVVSLYGFAKDQLSQENHYDFGLRSLKMVLAISSRIRLKFGDLSEEELLVHILEYSNIPKLTPQDKGLFSGFLLDLFPGVNHPNICEAALVKAVESHLSQYSVTSQQRDLQENQIKKVLQLHETQSSRHSTMLVGPSCGGKSFILQTLASAHFQFDNKIIKLLHLNPKAQCLKELHGHLDILTRDWIDGIFSHFLRNLNQPLPAGRCNEERWIVLDGDIDPIWVENLNSVMDENKLLTLPNGERIFLQPHCSIIFEVHDLQHASPATISRCGMVWVDPTDLPHKFYYENWFKHRYINMRENALLKELFTMYADHVIEFVKHGGKGGIGRKVDGLKLSEVIPSQPIELCKQLCHFLDAYLPPPQDEYVHDETTLKNIFIYCILFGVGGRLSSASRTQLNLFLVDICDVPIPTSNIYDYFFCTVTKTWLHLNTTVEKYKVSESFGDHHSIHLPTLTSVACENTLKNLLPITPTILFGERGSGKTSICTHVLSLLSNHEYSSMVVNMSSVPKSKIIKQILDSKIEKKTGNYYGASSSKYLAIFVDDLHVSQADSFGTNQPVEFMRTLLHQGFYHSNDDGLIEQKYVKGLNLVGSLSASSMKEIDLHPRFLSKSCLLYVPHLSNQDLCRVFGQIIEHRVLNQCGHEIGAQELRIFESITSLSIEILDAFKKKFPMSPSNFFYTFTVHNLSKIYEGLCALDERFFKNSSQFLKAWRKEIYHGFFDQFSSQEDFAFAECLFEEVVRDKSTAEDAKIILESSEMMLVDLTKVARIGNQHKSEKLDHNYETLKNTFGDVINDYDKEGHMKGSSYIILFKYVIDHILRIIHTLQQRQGHALLVGSGGSGKKSLVKLASYALDFSIFDIAVKKGYSKDTFRDDIKKALKRALSSPVVLLLSDELMRVKRSFLEIVNDILHTQNPLGLFDSDELKVFCDEFECADEKSLVQVCMMNLHVVFTVSPSGDFLKFLFQRFPTLVSSCMRDWFFPWPNEGLKMVSMDVLMKSESIEGRGNVGTISDHIVSVHNSVNKLASEFTYRRKRHYEITSKVFIDYLAAVNRTYQKIVQQNLASRMQYQEGLSKILDVSKTIHCMRSDLKEQKISTETKTVDIEKLISRIEEKTNEVTLSTQNAIKKQNEITKQDKQIRLEKQEADDALFEALPAIEQAANALSNIRKVDLQELKAFNNPPIHVKIVCQMCTILCPTGEKLGETWGDARKMLGNSRLIDSLKEYPKDNMTEKMYQGCKKILQENKKHHISVENLTAISKAGKGLLVWVLAILNYYEVKKQVDPLRRRVREKQKAQTTSKQELSKTNSLLKHLAAELDQLRMEYDVAKQELSTLQHQLSEMERRLNSAVVLINGLQEEQERWKDSHEALEKEISMMVGNALIYACFQSYCGPFDDEFRESLIHSVKMDLQARNIAFNEEIDVHMVALNEIELQEWTSIGVSMDRNFIQNCTLVMKGSRCPLCIDPHGQAMKWIKQYYGPSQNLCLKSAYERDYLKLLEIALEYGNPFLLELIDENIDPIITNILSQQLEEENGKRYVQLHEKRIEWNDQFALFLCTKLNNPCYTPEIMSTINLINFSMTKQGLIGHLLSVVLKEERPSLEIQYQDLMQKMGSNIMALNHFEGVLLNELNSSSGNILDNDTLVDTLNKTREKALAMKQTISECNQNKQQIEEARSVYHKVAVRGSTLYFSSIQLTHVNKMYEFSLELFSSQFISGMRKAQKSDLLNTRLQNLINTITKEIFNFISIGIFQSDRLAYAFHLLCMISGEHESPSHRIDPVLSNFFVRGNAIWASSTEVNDIGRKPPRKIMHYGVTPLAWGHLTYLSKHNIKFASIRKYLIEDPTLFAQWIQSESVEFEHPIFNKSETPFSNFEKLCLIRIFLPHQCYNAVQQFVIEEMGVEYVTPPSLDYEKVYLQSSPKTPILLVVSKGADPFMNIKNLGERFGFASPQKLHIVSLGQGQGPKALHAIKTATIMGHWVLLQNCHLLTSCVAELEGHLNGSLGAAPHKDFRLWLTTEPPYSLFPISILQMCHRVIIEAPDGLRVSMLSNLSAIDQSALVNCHHPKFIPILFSLAFVHSLIQERQKYGKLGWNVPYTFTQSDFFMSQQLLFVHLSKLIGLGIEDVSWDLIKYLIGDIIYGGRVSDREDSRILRTYFDEYFGDFLFVQNGFKQFYSLSTQNESNVMSDLSSHGNLDDFMDLVKSYPPFTEPRVLGFNENAKVQYFVDKMEDIYSKTKMMSSMYSMDDAKNDQTKKFKQLLSLSMQLLRTMSDNHHGDTQEPDGHKNNFLFDLDDLEQEQELLRNHAVDGCVLVNAIFFRELQHWNDLCTEVFNSLKSLVQSLNGEIEMNKKLDEMANSLYDGTVPTSWRKLSPPTTKKITSWIKYFQKRHEQYHNWFNEGQPQVIWLGGLHLPQCFLSALLQKSCRENSWALDEIMLHTEFTTSTDSESLISSSLSNITEDRAEMTRSCNNNCATYISGLYIEGAAWDVGNKCLIDQNSKSESFTELPLVKLVPVLKDEFDPEKYFRVPVYATSLRNNADGKGQIFSAYLDTKRHHSFWILQGVAVLLNIG